MEEAEIIRHWYWNKNAIVRNFILWELLKQVRHRSTDFVLCRERFAEQDNLFKSAQRFYSIGTFGFLCGQVQKRFFEEHILYWHFFHSIALLRFCGDDGKKLDLNADFEKAKFGFDTIIDIDSKKETLKERMEESYFEATKITDYLNKIDATYVVSFSGNAGFHIRILWNDLRQYFTVEDYGVANRELALFIVRESGAKLVDTGVLGSGRDLIRCLWSLNPKSLKVCKPLTVNEFSGFELGIVDPEWLLDNLPKNYEKTPLDYKREGNLDKLIKSFSSEYKPIERQAIKPALDAVDILARRINKLSKKEKEELMRLIKNG